MISDSTKKNILDLFSSSDKKDWKKIATKELDGADPFESLKILKEKLTVLPYYDQSDIPNTPFQLPVSKVDYKGNRAWENLSIVQTTNSISANEVALRALQSGADGLLFLVAQNSFSAALLKNIQWEHCALTFVADRNQQAFFKSLSEYALTQKLNKEKLYGSVFWKSTPHEIIDMVNNFKEFEKFQCLGICLEENIPKPTAIANALTQAVKYVDALTIQHSSVAQAITQIAFSVPIGTDFFLEIATLKTLRKLWAQIVYAYDPSIDSTTHVHAHSTAFSKAEFQSNANLIKSSTSSLAAVLGGCDSLSIEAEDENNVTLSRIARNVSSILMEESHLDLVADPTAGSYYLENLIDQLSKSSWQLFQETQES